MNAAWRDQVAEVPVVGMTRFTETQNQQTQQPTVQGTLTCGHTFEEDRGPTVDGTEAGGYSRGKGAPAVGEGHVQLAE